MCDSGYVEPTGNLLVSVLRRIMGLRGFFFSLTEIMNVSKPYFVFSKEKHNN